MNVEPLINTFPTPISQHGSGRLMFFSLTIISSFHLHVAPSFDESGHVISLETLMVADVFISVSTSGFFTSFISLF